MKARTEKPERKGLKAILSALPKLEEGLTQVDYTGDRPVFQLLVASNTEGNCVWIDSENHSSTYALSDTGSSEILEKVRIGRAFTPFQHHQLCTGLENYIDDKTEIVALPAANGLYEDGQINSEEAEELLEESLENVREIASRKGLKVLISNSRNVEGKLEYLTGLYTENNLSINETVEGLRFESQGFSTMAYPGKGAVQTTIPLWLKLRGEKHGKNKLNIQKASR
ncbi:MAG: hypothetical protein ABEJ87_03805 [Candidatus Nanohalobium sp.]